MGAADRIAEVILRQGEIAGRGAQNNGAIWGGALQNLGQQITALPTYVQNQRMREQEVAMRNQEMQMRTSQMQQLQRAQASQDAANKVVAGFPRRADGTYDVGGMIQQMSGSGVHPADVEHYGSTFEKLNQLSTAAVEAQRQHQARAADIILSGAQGQEITPEDVHVALATLKTLPGGLVNDEDEQAWTQAFAAGQDPRKFLESVSRAGHAPEKPITLKSDERLLTPEGKVLVPSEPKVGEGQHVINGQLVGPDGKPIGAQIPPQVTPAELETQRHNQALEAAQKLQFGREAAVNAETARHNSAMETIDRQRLKQEAGPVGTVGANIPDVAPGQKNEDFLKVLPPETAAKVKALVEGRLSLPTRFAKGDTYWQGLLDAATKYDPSFDAANYNARSKARQDLTSPSGTGGKTINAMNTALQHAGRLSDLIEKLDNYDTPIANAVVNPLRSAAGSTSVTNFNAVAPQLMKEIERAWRGSGGSSGEIQDLIKSIGPNMGKQQQREALAQFVELLQGKLDSTTQQRDAVMGPAGASIPVLFKNNEGVMDKILSRAGGSSAAPPAALPAVPAGMIRAFDPNGQPHLAKQGTPLPAGWTLAK